MSDPILKFKEDGTFNIVALADIHWRNGDALDLRSHALVQDLLAAERPDLVVVLGDAVHKLESAEPLAAFERALTAVAESGIPWAFVFGNHDLEADVDAGLLVDLLERMPGSLFRRGPAGVAGDSNYVVEVAGSRSADPAALLYMFDSGAKTKQPFGGSAWVQRSQIDWYAAESARFAAAAGSPVPALAFLHIPLPEYNEIWDFKTCYGWKNSNVACPKVNSGLFAAMVEQGDVTGVFCGHNHHNNYYGDLHGIRLAYARLSGYGKGRENYLRGATVIRLREGERPFDMWQRLEDGTVIDRPPVHPPAYVDPFGKRNVYPPALPKRIVDVDNEWELPRRFRMTTSPMPADAASMPDLSGLRELLASASGQFSQNGLRRMKESIGDRPIVIVDLRQESHAFVNGMAVSWYGQANGANQGLTPKEVLREEERLLDRLKGETAVFFDQLEGKSANVANPLAAAPATVRTEEELVKEEGLGYTRFFVTDHHRPLDHVVDRFIEFVRSLPEGTWLHFHCRGGVGRASTFMLMHDMLRNAASVRYEDILDRQRLIGGRDMNAMNPDDAVKYGPAVERLAFLGRFYDYCLTAAGRNPSPPTWSEWEAQSAGLLQG